jgi:hypothetical protein
VCVGGWGLGVGVEGGRLVFDVVCPYVYLLIKHFALVHRSFKTFFSAKVFSSWG